MKKITKAEIKEEIHNGTGICHHMGGWASINGKEILIVNNEKFLFEKEEVNGEEWKRMIQLQNKETQIWLKEVSALD